MGMKWKRKVLLAKVEVTYGTDPTPTGAANAILARNVRLSPLKQNYDDRELGTVSHFGTRGKIIAGSSVELSFDVEVAGSGAAGTAPGWGVLCRGCAMSETVTPATSTVYAPVSTGEESITIYMYIDGRLHKLTGARGSMKVALEAGKVPLMSFTFTGLYTIPSDTALATPTLTAYQKPLAVNLANTTPATLHTFSGKFRSISLDIANEIAYRNLVGSESVQFTGRKVTGSFALEDELVATKDWWTIVKAGTLGALAVTHGTAAGNKVALAGANVQLLDPEMSEESGIAMLRMGAEFTPSASGNDEFSITVT